MLLRGSGFQCIENKHSHHYGKNIENQKVIQRIIFSTDIEANSTDVLDIYTTLYF